MNGEPFLCYIAASILWGDRESRRNTPVIAIAGALIIKELFDYSDDEIAVRDTSWYTIE